MNKNLISFLFFVFFITGCQQNVAPSSAESSSESEVIPVYEEDAESDDFIENDVSLENEETIENDDIINNDNVSSETVVEELLIEKPLTPYERVTLNLIELGERALAAERLLTPVDDNANMYFQVALGRDPGNFRATQGIASIVDIYTDWAWIAARARDYQKAERYLDDARSVNPEDALIVEMTAKIAYLKKQRARTTVKQEKKKPEPVPLKEGQYLLPKNLFSLTEDEIIAEIQPIIDTVSKTEQSLEIYWPNDKEARLIYQIINSRIPDFRVRAMTYRRASYMVELQQY